MSDQNTPSAKPNPKALGGRITFYRDENRTRQAWYYRFRNPLRTKGYIRKSSKTTELALAKRIAIDHYEELMVKARMGLVERKTTIRVLVEKFTKELPRTSQKPARDNLEKYWERYFGPVVDDDLANLDDTCLLEFAYWRQDPKNYAHNVQKDPQYQRDKGERVKGVHAIAKATLQNELKYLRFYFRRGFETGRLPRIPNTHIQYENLPYVSDQQPNKRRGRFTDEQLKVIESWRSGFVQSWKHTLKLEAEGKEATNEMFQGHKINRFHRTTFYMLISLVINTGIRPQEIRKLKWCDIRKDEEEGQVFTWVHIRREVAKRSRNAAGKERMAICSNMEVMYERFLMYAKEWERMFGRPPNWTTDADDSDYIFANPRDPERNRNPSNVIKNGLERISEEKGFVVHGNLRKDPLYPDGKNWKQNTLYSFRSAYMTRQLQHGTTLYHLSKQVGSSVKSITTAYAIDEAKDYWKYYTAHVRALREQSKRKD